MRGRIWAKRIWRLPSAAIPSDMCLRDTNKSIALNGITIVKGIESIRSEFMKTNIQHKCTDIQVLSKSKFDTPRSLHGNRSPSNSSQISIKSSHRDSKQSRIRAAHRTLLPNPTIGSNIIVWESVAMSVNVRRVNQSRVVLIYIRQNYFIISRQPQRSTYIRHSILVVLSRSDFVRVLASHQQSAAVESSSQARDNRVLLRVTASGERPGRAAEDVTCCGFWEGDGAVCVGEDIVANLADYVTVRGLRVDCERLGGVAGPD
jgi:hypothetical protein